MASTDMPTRPSDPSISGVLLDMAQGLAAGTGINPDKALIYDLSIAVAQLLHNRRQDQQAVALIDDILVDHPKAGEALSLAARCREAMNDPEAIRFWRRLVDLEPKNLGGLKGLARCHLADHDPLIARRYAAEARHIAPRDAEAGQLHAQSLERSGDLSAALEAWRAVMADQPDNPAAWQAVGRLSYRVGDRALARTLLFGTAAGPQGNALPALHLLREAERAGEWDEAFSILEWVDGRFGLTPDLNLVRLRLQMTIGIPPDRPWKPGEREQAALERLKDINDRPSSATDTYQLVIGGVPDVPLTMSNRLSSAALRRLSMLLLYHAGIGADVETLRSINHVTAFVADRIRGRIANDQASLIVNFALRQQAGQQIEGPCCDLEIGVLFGGSLILAHRAHHQKEKRILILGIDPLDGYYKLGRDPHSGLPVDKVTVYDNLLRLGVLSEDVTLCVASSNSDAAKEFCSDRKLCVLYIDGDHSFDGIRLDWENYSDLVQPGGYVIIDNYLDEVWPDVTRFVHETLFTDRSGKWLPVLVFQRMIVFKRTDHQPA